MGLIMRTFLKDLILMHKVVFIFLKMIPKGKTYYLTFPLSHAIPYAINPTPAPPPPTPRPQKKTLNFSIWQAGIETVFFAERINFIDETEH